MHLPMPCPGRVNGMIKDALAQVSALCVGATAMALGDPTAGVATATAAGGLAAVVLGRRAELAGECDRVFARVQAAYSRDWAEVPLSPEDRAAIAVVDALLRDGARECLLDRAALAATAFEPETFPAKATETILARLGISDPRQGHPEIARRYAAALVSAGLSAAMEQDGFYRGFRLELSLEQARRIGLLGAEVPALAEKVDALIRDTAGPRELLENLVQRFRFANPDAPLAELGEFLKEKAAEWKELKARLAALEAEDPRIANARAAAEAAIAATDFDGADAMLAGAEELQQEHRTLVEVRRQAGLRQARAEALLLKGDADGAAAHVEAAAGFLQPFAPLEAAEARHTGAGRLHDEGLRLGGTGLLRAIELCRQNATVYTRAAHPVDWAMTQNNLGVTLRQQAGRTEGAAGAGAARRGGGGLSGGARGPHPGGASAGLGDDAGEPGAGVRDRGDLGGGAAGAYGRAMAAFDLALEVFAPAGMGPNAAKCARKARGAAAGGNMNTTLGRVHLARPVPM